LLIQVQQKETWFAGDELVLAQVETRQMMFIVPFLVVANGHLPLHKKRLTDIVLGTSSFFNREKLGRRLISHVTGCRYTTGIVKSCKSDRLVTPTARSTLNV
jgi:hypothetical protein